MFNIFKTKKPQMTNGPARDESEINKRVVTVDDDNVIFSGAVDSFSDTEDRNLREPDAPGIMKVQNDKKLAKFF